MTTNRHILCVDDHKDTCDMLAFVLRGENYEVASANGIEEGWQQIQNQDFDLFIIDHTLADGLGLDLCQCIRKSGRTAPIIFYSGLGTESVKDNAKAAGANAYLVKPVHL